MERTTMTNRLNNLKVGEREMIIIESCAVAVERAQGRGSYATVTDAGHGMNGEYVFASTPALAFSILMDKIAAGVAA